MSLSIVSQATIVSGHFYEKRGCEEEEKNAAERIIVLGDMHAIGVGDEPRLVHADRLQKQVLFENFDSLARSNGSTGVLCSFNTDNMSQDDRLEILEQDEKSLDIYSALSRRVVANLQNGSGFYIPFDLRTKAITGPSQMSYNLNQVAQCDFNKNFREVVADSKINFLDWLAVRETFIKSKAGNATVKEYLNELDALAQRSESTVHFHEIGGLVGSMHSFFAKVNQNSLCVNVIYDALVANPKASLRFDDTVVARLHSLLGNVSLELAFHAARKKFDQLIIVAGHNQAVHANNLMAGLQDIYSLVLKSGLQQRRDSVEASKASRIFVCQLGFLSTLFGKKVCFVCNQEVQELRHCGKCKKSKYCSVVCQKADWSGHREECDIY